MNTATRSLFLACLALASPPRPAAAQEVPPTAPQETPAPPSFDELQATIARMQRQLDGLGAAASERDAALRFLEQQVDQAAGQITGTGQANEALRGEAATLSTRMEDLGRDRERLSREAGEQAASADQLAAQVAALTGELERERGARAAETARLTAELAGARRALDEAQTLLSAAETRVD
jgi:chromosome segregation ATPase